jgi:acyl carrier protein
VETPELIELLKHAAENSNPKLAAQIAAHGSETALFGKGGCLDSLGLVSFIVAVETEIEDRFGETLTLADERAMSQRHSPFRTVLSLAEYIKAVREKN